MPRILVTVSEATLQEIIGELKRRKSAGEKGVSRSSVVDEILSNHYGTSRMDNSWGDIGRTGNAPKK